MHIQCSWGEYTQTSISPPLSALEKCMYTLARLKLVRVLLGFPALKRPTKSNWRLLCNKLEGKPRKVMLSHTQGFLTQFPH